MRPPSITLVCLWAAVASGKSGAFAPTGPGGRHGADDHGAACGFVPGGNKGLTTPTGRYIPDGVVAPPGHFKGAPPWAATEGVLLVFDVTSTSPDDDRRSKRAGYAASGIPCHLLIDRSEGKVTLFTAPEEGDYAEMTQVKFGKRLPLPAPFSFELDTATFG